MSGHRRFFVMSVKLNDCSEKLPARPRLRGTFIGKNKLTLIALAHHHESYFLALMHSLGMIIFVIGIDFPLTFCTNNALTIRAFSFSSIRPLDQPSLPSGNGE